MTASFTGGNVYEKLGVRPVINAQGNLTVLGGSIPPPAVKKAADEAGERHVFMRELLDKAGEFIASLMGTEAAYPTSGCAAAISLSAAACMAGGDPVKIARLPDTAGLKNEFIIQKNQRYSADACYRFPGGRLIEAGDDAGCTPQQLEDAIGPRTAAFAYFLHADVGESVLSVKDVADIGRRRGVPVIVDAAYQIYPLDHFRWAAQSADLVCFSSKYYGGPNSAGFVTGRKDLISAVAAQGFTQVYPQAGISGPGYVFGRGMKLDRQEVVALLAALDGWFDMDHEDRLNRARSKMSVVRKALEGVPNVETRVAAESNYLRETLHVVLGPGASKTARQVAEELDAGDPRIKLGGGGDGALVVVTHTLRDGEEAVVADRLRAVLVS